VKPIRKLALVVNRDKPGAEDLAHQLAAEAKTKGLETRITHDYPVPEGFLKDQDACCVLGGDGTLLGAVAESTRWQTPLIGINQGKLGFLATFSPDEARQQFLTLLEGHYQVVDRMVLSCETTDGQSALALNDIVIKHSGNSHLIGLGVFSNDELVTDYYCDGLIFATPTGSTAYNLSAGGPIVHPAAQVITMTPICPHTLTNRSLIFEARCCLHVHALESLAPAQVNVDGQSPFGTQPLLPLTIRIAPKSLPLLQPKAHSHFRILRNKLRWGSESEQP
jgi:NAD+ kinase